jgi:tetratricopeptide (TPR) repeat protein
VSDRPFETATIADMEDTSGWAPIRKRFGVESFGINAWTAHEAGGRIIPEHDEAPSEHEEIYVVVSGHATFTVDGEEVDGASGTVVYVRDPTAKRAAFAREAGTTVLAVGAAPGRAFRPRSWELQVGSLLDEGQHLKAKRLLTEALDHYEDKAGVLYNLACAESLLGETDEALGHLRQAIEGHPAFVENAREDPDFEPLRSDPRFGELVGTG